MCSLVICRAVPANFLYSSACAASADNLLELHVARNLSINKSSFSSTISGLSSSSAVKSDNDFAAVSLTSVFVPNVGISCISVKFLSLFF